MYMYLLYFLSKYALSILFWSFSCRFLLDVLFVVLIFVYFYIVERIMIGIGMESSQKASTYLIALKILVLSYEVYASELQILILYL